MTEGTPQTLTCYVHPQRETLLRCNRCERPICQSCAVLTPTGYRCKECVKGQQKIFDTSRWWDRPLVVITAGVLSYIGSLIVGSFGFFTILVAPLAGMVIAEAVRLVIRKRRFPGLPILAAGATLVGGIIVQLISDLIFLPYLLSTGGGFAWMGLLWNAIYAVLAAGTVYSRFKGIRI